MEKQVFYIYWLALAVLIAVCTSAAAQPTPAAESQQPKLMDRQKEIALALSACPPSVASKAAVYVLEKSGYVKVRDSQNGFTAIVQHAIPASQDPQCMDAEGTRTFLPRYLKVAELRAQGKSREEIKRFVADAFSAAEQAGRRLHAFDEKRGDQRGKRHRRTFPATCNVLRALPDQRRSGFGRDTGRAGFRRR